MNRLQALRALIIEAADEGSRISVTGHTTGRFGETINRDLDRARQEAR
jgi:hypothetical protein